MSCNNSSGFCAFGSGWWWIIILVIIVVIWGGNGNGCGNNCLGNLGSNGCCDNNPCGCGC